MGVSRAGRVAHRELMQDPGASFQWRPDALVALGDALAEDFDESEGPQAVDDLLRVIVMLRSVWGAAAAAADLVEVLRAEPAALRLLRRRYQHDGGLNSSRAFARREGRTFVLRAPEADANAPAGSIPLTDLIDPHRLDRARARRVSNARRRT